MKAPLLEVRDLRVNFRSFDSPPVPVLRGVDLQLTEGEALGLVGPSGCGKSLTTRAVCGLLPRAADWSGEIRWQGRRLTDPGGKDWQAMRGAGATLVLQEPASSLNPVIPVGRQITETLEYRQGLTGSEARIEMLSLLEEVRIADAGTKSRLLPHELSGGMRQRVLLAAALACRPRLLIADEPTTALDLSVQRDILALLAEVCRRHGTALLFITHERDLVPLLARRMAVMSEGRITRVETATVCSAETSVARPATEVNATPIVLAATGLAAGYRSRSRSWFGREAASVPVITDVDLELRAGRAVGLAGESGCGKTTLARVLTGHLPPLRGELQLDGVAQSATGSAADRGARRARQLVFQDPTTSLNPRLTVGRTLAEAAGAGGRTRVPDLLAEVGLDAGLAGRLPGQLSGGQRQRVAIARALSVVPRVLVADEPTSALDAAARDRILDLLRAAMRRHDLALLLISHDPTQLDRVCDQVLVMLGGVVVETYLTHDQTPPCHPYTQALLAASPRRLAVTGGLTTSSQGLDGPKTEAKTIGCPWYRSCSIRKPQCENELPHLQKTASGHALRCPFTG